MEIAERISQAVEYLRFNNIAKTHSDLAKVLNRSRANVTAAINGNERYLTLPFLKHFAKTFGNYINEDWLLTGEGQMERVDKRRLRPHIPAEIVTVAAGFMGTSIGSVSEDDCDMLPIIPYLPTYDFIITVSGDSMEPMLLHNDKIACAWIEPSDTILPDKVYVVDSIEGAVVKSIEPIGEDIVCRSLNPRYKDYTINKNEVLRLARVVGVVREM